ncbi:MAG: hypothetical protein C0501_20970, partial [Isosphaera sp.]|nr:hypothetical protein [Isosphaera sp.]
EVLSAAWSPDGLRMVTAGMDRTTHVWDAQSGAEVTTLRGHVTEVCTAAWSPDGSRIATADGTFAMVWDATPTDPQFLPKELAPPPRPK